MFEFKQKRTHFKIEQIFVVFSTKICVANKIFQKILKKNLFATQNFVEKTTKICSILKCVRFCLNSNKIYIFIFYSVGLGDPDLGKFENRLWISKEYDWRVFFVSAFVIYDKKN